MVNRDEVAIRLLKSLQPNPFLSNQNLELIKRALSEYGDAKRREGYSEGYDEGMQYGVESANPSSWE